MSDSGAFDLDQYLAHIGWEGERRADLATLRGVHLAHMRGIPFENLDALRRTAPSLEPADLMAKLVHGRRGGYCYEHNTLLAGMLEALGFGVTRLAARVVVGTDRIESRPRTHMTLLVEVPGDPQPYLADVGFGAIGALLEPVPLAVGVESHDAGRRHRFVHLPQRGPLELWMLEAYAGEKGEKGEQDGGSWLAQYAFTLEPFERVDFEVINWHIATNPRSPFTQRLFVQRVAAGRHLLLHGSLLTETRADGEVREREVADEAEARRVLEEEFGIEAPDGMTLLV
ncbi:arylamine N-acetyltransferase family protein [Streptomyces pseudovenezuelae]|uniref:N-hydroxyarylamine O-acetyltransferase n=1 Tax=Streptomyces pseudovenezuelae TaxID=67350 RepID=A0ABT6M239_9ACTN|nr:arylamine N-acetyltransferase [Streptomyces pseudovenezuelae]MDH6222620.1 N-hydroxyarylamine O-acetyltransferase [Streptomyces pseudovenezuelae]